MDSSYELWKLSVLASFMKPHLHPDQTVLDLGCGDGLLETILKETEVHITGIDLSDSSIQSANARQIPNCLFLKDDALNFLKKSEKYYDVIIASAFLGALDHAQLISFADMSWNHLKPGGRQIIFISNKHPLYTLLSPDRVWSRWTWKHYSKKDIKTIFQHFKQIEIETFGSKKTFWREFYHALYASLKARGLKLPQPKNETLHFWNNEYKGTRYLLFVFEKPNNSTT